MKRTSGDGVGREDHPTQGRDTLFHELRQLTQMENSVHLTRSAVRAQVKSSSFGNFGPLLNLYGKTVLQHK